MYSSFHYEKQKYKIFISGGCLFWIDENDFMKIYYAIWPDVEITDTTGWIEVVWYAGNINENYTSARILLVGYINDTIAGNLSQTDSFGTCDSFLKN